MPPAPRLESGRGIGFASRRLRRPFRAPSRNQTAQQTGRRRRLSGLSIAVVAISTMASPTARALVIATPSGVIAPVVRTTAAGYLVRTPCGSTAIVAYGTPLGRPVVVLDPGHGGDEQGAIGPAGLEEKAVNLAVAQAAQRALEGSGYPTVLTRTGDYRITLSSRAAIVNALQPRLLVSIHHNADPDGPHGGPGTETYYRLRSRPSRRLAGLLYEDLTSALTSFNAAWVGDTDAGAKVRVGRDGHDYYSVLRNAKVPAALVEAAFITNASEEQLLARADVQRAEGEAIAQAIIRSFTTSEPGRGFVAAYPRNKNAGPGGGGGGCVDPSLA